MNFFFLIEYPREKGIEISEKENLVEDDADNEEVEGIDFKDALCIPGVMSFAGSFFFIKFATYGVYYWMPTYLQEHMGYSKNASI